MSSNEKLLPNGTTGYKLTKEDFAQINRRNLIGFQAGWNYERMQHSGYLWIILPQLRKIYGDNTEGLKTAARTHCAPFFNTSNFLNTIITGIDLAIEEEEGLQSLETVASLKTASWARSPPSATPFSARCCPPSSVLWPLTWLSPATRSASSSGSP